MACSEPRCVLKVFRNDGDHQPGRAEAELGQMLEFGSLNSFIVDVGTIRGVQIAEPDHVMRHAYDTMQSRNLWVINFEVGAATCPPYAGPCFGHLVRQAVRGTRDDRNCDRPIVRRCLCSLGVKHVFKRGRRPPIAHRLLFHHSLANL